MIRAAVILFYDSECARRFESGVIAISNSGIDFMWHSERTVCMLGDSNISNAVWGQVKHAGFLETFGEWVPLSCEDRSLFDDIRNRFVEQVRPFAMYFYCESIVLIASRESFCAVGLPVD